MVHLMGGIISPRGDPSTCVYRRDQNDSNLVRGPDESGEIRGAPIACAEASVHSVFSAGGPSGSNFRVGNVVEVVRTFVNCQTNRNS